MVFEVAGAAPVAAPVQAAAAPAAAPAQAATPAAAAPATSGEFQENHEYSHASPVVRRLAREFGVNLAKVKGSGRKNRILKEDVQNYVKEALKRLESGAQAAAQVKVMAQRWAYCLGQKWTSASSVIPKCNHCLASRKSRVLTCTVTG